MSELWERRIRTYFKQIDCKDNGFISMKDVIDMAEGYSDAEKVTDCQREETRLSFTDIFRWWKKSAGTGDDGLLTPAIFIESVRQQRNDPEYKAAHMRHLHLYFKILDLSGDGYLQEEEIAKSVTGMGWKDASFVHGAFECMDLNKDGKVSLEEYCTAIFEYIDSEDEQSRYNMIFGPLV